jgi:hypothetical protein
MLVGKIAFAQNRQVNGQNDNFFLQYSIAGLGSNLGRLMPTLRIYNRKFKYTKEQNSYWGKRSKKKKFISKGTLRQGSIDSIYSIVRELKDSIVYRTNPCIMSGGITNITIAFGADTTKFTLHNTSDYTALKIIEIINAYLPRNSKLYDSAEEIEQEKECWKYLQEKIDQQLKDSTKSKQ